MKLTNLKIISAIAFILLWLFMSLLFMGCNPVKQVLKDEKKIDKVWEAGVLKDRCQYDSDTIYLTGRTDSIYVPIRIEKKVFDSNAYADVIENLRRKNDSDCLTSMQMSYTAGYNDAIDKVSKEKIPVKKPDTAFIRKADRSKIDLLDKKLFEQHKETVRLTQQIKDEQLNTKEQKQRANKWRFNFWALIIAAGIYTFRKSIFKLITKIPI